MCKAKTSQAKPTNQTHKLNKQTKPTNENPENKPTKQKPQTKPTNQTQILNPETKPHKLNPQTKPHKPNHKPNPGFVCGFGLCAFVFWFGLWFGLWDLICGFGLWVRFVSLIVSSVCGVLVCGHNPNSQTKPTNKTCKQNHQTKTQKYIPETKPTNQTHKQTP